MAEENRSVIVINRFFGGTHTPTGRMASDFVEKLLESGHRVTVLTGKNAYAASDKHLSDRRIKMFYTFGRNRAGRLETWLVFWLQTLLWLPFIRWKRCIIMTDPPFLIFAAVIAKIIHPNRQLYWWTMDLYPEALVASKMDFLGKSFITGVCSWLTNYSIKQLTGVICLGQTQKKCLMLYKSWPDNDRDFSIIVPPWDFRELNTTQESVRKFKKEMGWCNRKIALYAGNLGEAHSYNYIVRLARKLATNSDSTWLFAFVCRGAKVLELKRTVADLSNVFISDYLPSDRSGVLLSAADLHVVTMSDGWEGIVVPSKLYGVLKNTAQILFVGPETADTAIEIKYLGVGWIVRNEDDVSQTVRKLNNLSSRPPIQSTRVGLEQMVAFITQTDRPS